MSQVSVCQSATNLRSVSVDRDSGNYSLQSHLPEKMRDNYSLGTLGTASISTDKHQAHEAAEF